LCSVDTAWGYPGDDPSANRRREAHLTVSFIAAYDSYPRPYNKAVVVEGFAASNVEQSPGEATAYTPQQLEACSTFSNVKITTLKLSYEQKYITGHEINKAKSEPTKASFLSRWSALTNGLFPCRFNLCKKTR